jgi:dTDP-4-amino-4,6-dideoxygalactose transaminase
MTGGRTIPFARPWITQEERDAVLGVLGGDILTHGPQNHAFEAEFAAFTGGESHCLAVSSCMAALHLTYWQLGIGAGDEVIVPAQTHVATAHAVEVVGAKAVFVDCLPETGNMDPNQIEALITPRTRAIGLVHFLGIPCEMDAIMDVANRHGLKVIEDCALAVGARYRGTHVGLIGDAGCFSFYPVKHMTTGDGGMFISRHADFAEQVKKARAFGVDRSFAERSIPGMYDVPTLGVNYRMSDINAALGRVQLKRIGEILGLRERHFRSLQSQLGDLPNLRILDSQNPEAPNSYYCLSVVLRGSLAGRRTEVIERLRGMGVGTSVYYPQPVPRMTYYREKYGYDPAAFPNATEISDESIALPVGPHLSDEDVDYIAAAVTRVVGELN